MKLKSTLWLYDMNGDPQLPADLCLSDLHSQYPIDSEEARYLAERLDMRSEVLDTLIQQLPAAMQEDLRQMEELKKATAALGISLESIVETFKAQAKKETEEEIAKEYESLGEVTIEKQDFEPEEISSTIEQPVAPPLTATGTGHSTAEDTPPVYQHKKGKEVTIKVNNDKNKQVGEEGEMIAMKYLREQYELLGTITETANGFSLQQEDGTSVEVIRLNSDAHTGYGCDIIINENNVTTQYIEVKASRIGDKEYYPVTGYQWELARNLHDAGNGHQYKIFVVKKVGSKKPVLTEIINPIELWKAGELYAHPVNFKL